MITALFVHWRIMSPWYSRIQRTPLHLVNSLANSRVSEDGYMINADSLTRQQCKIEMPKGTSTDAFHVWNYFMDQMQHALLLEKR